MQHYPEPATDKKPPVSIEAIGPRVPIYTAEFAADPHGAYQRMRDRYGSLVPVEIWPDVPATLVIGYRTAVRILNDPEHMSADPRPWQKTVPDQLPIMPMLEWRPNALRSNGNTVEHTRYRKATNEALAGIDQHALRTTIERSAVPLINSFCRTGRTDLLSQYCLPLVFEVLNRLLGCPPHIGQQVANASKALFEGVDTATVNSMLDTALLELTQLKRREPGADLTTRLVQHPAQLSDTEMIHQLVTCYSAGIEIPQNLIANTLLLMLTDRKRFMSNELGFPPSTRSALDEILATDPPLANYCITYPLQPILIDSVWLPANQPVMTSMAACNNSPELNTGEYAGSGWNLAWGSGPHSCPMHARSTAQLIALDAIDQLLDALPELQLAIPATELLWRPGPFHRALTELPVTFPESPPLNPR